MHPMPTIARLPSIATRALAAFAALLLAAGAAQAQRSITSSAGGGGVGEYLVQNAYTTLRACNPGDAFADGCTMGSGTANAVAAAAFAMQFGSSRGEQWNYLANATDGLGVPFVSSQFLGPAGATARVSFSNSFRHNLVLAVDGVWADPAQGGAETAWTAYFVYRDVLAEDTVDPVNTQPLAPQTFGASLQNRQQQLLVRFFDNIGDPVFDPDLGLVQYVGQSAGLQVRGASAYFFDVSAAAPGAAAAVPEPGTLALAALALAAAAAAGLRRRRLTR